MIRPGVLDFDRRDGDGLGDRCRNTLIHLGEASPDSRPDGVEVLVIDPHSVGSRARADHVPGAQDHREIADLADEVRGVGDEEDRPPIVLKFLDPCHALARERLVTHG